MTNIDFNDIIDALIISISKKEGSIEISMEVNAEDLKQIVFPHCKRELVIPKIRMQNPILELKEITYYLIQLFYKTREKYSCTQTKLGKMLSILAFRYARKGKTLFCVPIYKYPPRCGTLIKALTFIPKDIYEREFNQNNPDTTDKIADVIDDSILIKAPYNDVNNLSLETKQDIKDLFVNFGAYPADELGKLLNPIVDQLVKTQDDELDLSRLPTLEKKDIHIEQNGNKIVDYIYQ